MSEQADNMLESPLHHRMNHHGSNNGNLLLQQQQQQDEITQLTNVQTTNDNDLNNLSVAGHNSVATTSVATTTQPPFTSSPASTTATMAALATANAIAVARAAAAAAAAAQAAMNIVSNSNSTSNNSTSNMNSSGTTTTHQPQHTTRRNANSVNSNSNLTNSITINNTTNNEVGAGNNDGNHLNVHRVVQKSRDCHQQQQQQQHNSSTRQTDDVTNIVVGDVIIGESDGGDEENVIIGHGTATQGTGEEDEFQLQLHHHHNILVHENEIEIDNVVEHEAMQHHEEVIIGGAHPIVIKTEAGDHDLSGRTVTLVSADSLQQQQLQHITVSGRENNTGGLNNGSGQDGSRMQTSHHHHHGPNIITIPVVGSMPYTVISDSDPFKMNAESGVILQGHSTPVDGCDGYCCQYKKNRDENGTTTTRVATSLAQDPLHAVSRSGNLTTQATRLVNSTSNVVTNVSSSALFCNSHLTWEEAVSAPVLPVRCKDTNAELYKNKFGSGNKGKCIKSGNDWFTPTEFEALCGRGNSKDWKRSIRFGGRTLQTLIDKGFLVPHASSCICSNCVDDATATGPIRPFTPYQRKRKSQSGEPAKQIKLERLTSKDSNTDESSDVGTPGSTLFTGLSLTQALMKVNQMQLPPSIDDAWKVLEEGVDQVVTAAASLKNLVQEMKERTTQETEELRSQLQNSLQTAVQSSVVGHPQILRIFDNNRIQTYSIEVLDPDSFTPVQTNATTITKCDNCGREGSLECSGCHGVHYCSPFCQKKDWPTHQAACQDRGNQLKEEIL